MIIRTNKMAAFDTATGTCYKFKIDQTGIYIIQVVSPITGGWELYQGTEAECRAKFEALCKALGAVELGENDPPYKVAWSDGPAPPVINGYDHFCRSWDEVQGMYVHTYRKAKKS